MGRVARLLIAAAVAVPLVGSAAGPAAACACVPLDAKQIVHGADAIIAGRIQDQVPLDATNTRSTVKVEGVYRGNVPSTIYVDASLGAGGGSDCAVLYPVGARVDPMVLRKLPGGSYTIDECAMGSVPHMRALLGAARPPPLGGAPPLAGLSPGASSGAVPVPVATSTPISGLSWGAVGLGLVLAVILIAAGFRLSGRRAVETASPFDDVPVPPGDEPATDEPDGPEPDASG